LPLVAQNVVSTGSLAGRVADETGSLIADATMAVKNLDNGVELSTTTNRDGIYRFPVLTPGTYSLAVSAKGFRDADTLVRVLVGNTTSQDLQLRVGASAEKVTVPGTTPLLRPTETSASTVLERSFTDELPLNGRKYTNFATLTPNTSYDGDTGLVSMGGQQGGEDTGYANGNGAVSFAVDGSNATNNYFSDIIGRYRIPYLYGEDAIQEFQVSVSPYSALYGGGAGFVNAVTRSGGNQFHGSAFYYNRNSATAANNAVNIAAGIPKPDDSLQQFGAGVGGPIVRNRMWFFVDYEQQLRNFPVSVINSDFSTNPSNLESFLNTNFGIPPGVSLPPPNGPLPLPGTDTVPDYTNPVYLQQVSNAVSAQNLNLGSKSRHGNDLVITPRIDFKVSSRDGLFLTLNFNRFNSPGGVITVPTTGSIGLQTLANANVHTFQASLGWTHTFSSRLLNEFHASTSQDDEKATPTGLAPNSPTIVIQTPSSFTIGNAAFSIGRVFERQYSVADRINWVLGKHTLQFGFDWNWSHDSDTNDGGADPNEAVAFGSRLGLYVFPSLQAFALGQYGNFSQAAGNPTFSFYVPYYGFYVQDTYRVLPQLTLEMGLRQDFQVYPQPVGNPNFPVVGRYQNLTAQYPNQFLRIAPRLGFAWQPRSKTVVRGGFGKFYSNMNGLNYRNAVISNGLASQQSSAFASYNGGAPNQQAPTFPNILPANDPLFQSSADISLVSPQFRAPYTLQTSLQIQQELAENTTLTVGTMWSHGVHLLSSSAYDLNLNPLQGTTNYVLCAANTTQIPCNGRTITLPTMDAGLLSEGYLTPNFNQINELISPALNHYNSLFVQLQRQFHHGLAMQLSYTWAKNVTLNGMDFNNQFDFSNTHAPALLDQRHRLTFAAIYQPHLESWTESSTGRALLSGWKLSTVMEFASGRPYAGLLAPACTTTTPSGSLANLSCASTGNGNLNDTAFNQDTANTAAGISQSGPTPGIGLNSFYGPWLQRVDIGLARAFTVAEGKQLQFQVQAFNVFNHANYYVQNGNGVNQIQYNPYGQNCGDSMSVNQTCYLVPNSGAGNFGTLQEINPNGLPRVLQFSARFTF
jgi:hypothetical protein